MGDRPLGGSGQPEAPIIRPAGPDDLQQVLALFRHLNPNDPAPDPARADAAWRALLGCSTVLVAERAGTLIATCTLTIIPHLTRNARPYGLIENVVSHVQHRRAGLGRAVMLAALDRAWQADCYKVMLASGRDENTLRFYDDVGFTRGGKTFFEMRRP